MHTHTHTGRDVHVRSCSFLAKVATATRVWAKSKKLSKDDTEGQWKQAQEADPENEGKLSRFECKEPSRLI